jgi:hypothetical protein
MEEQSFVKEIKNLHVSLKNAYKRQKFGFHGPGLKFEFFIGMKGKGYTKKNVDTPMDKEAICRKNSRESI